MNSGTQDRYPLQFFCLLFLLSIPFWLYGTFASEEILPRLPASAVMVVCPTIAATYLIWRSGGAPAFWAFFRSTTEITGPQLWVWLVAVSTMPLVMLLSALVLVSFGQPLPDPEITLVKVVSLFLLFLIAAIVEEIGWTGYAARPLILQHGLLLTGLIIGCIAAIWHIVPLLQADRDLLWIAWWTLGTICRRILILWLYVKGGQRVLLAAVFHAMNNVSWMMFPVMGSHYDPVSTGIVLLIPVALVAFITGNSHELETPGPSGST